MLGARPHAAPPHGSRPAVPALTSSRGAVQLGAARVRRAFLPRARCGLCPSALHASSERVGLADADTVQRSSSTPSRSRHARPGRRRTREFGPAREQQTDKSFWDVASTDENLTAAERRRTRVLPASAASANTDSTGLRQPPRRASSGVPLSLSGNVDVMAMYKSGGGGRVRQQRLVLHSDDGSPSSARGRGARSSMRAEEGGPSDPEVGSEKQSKFVWSHQRNGGLGRVSSTLRRAFPSSNRQIRSSTPGRHATPHRLRYSSQDAHPSEADAGEDRLTWGRSNIPPASSPPSIAGTGTAQTSSRNRDQPAEQVDDGGSAPSDPPTPSTRLAAAGDNRPDGESVVLDPETPGHARPFTDTAFTPALLASQPVEPPTLAPRAASSADPSTAAPPSDASPAGPVAVADAAASPSDSAAQAPPPSVDALETASAIDSDPNTPSSTGSAASSPARTSHSHHARLAWILDPSAASSDPSDTHAPHPPGDTGDVTGAADSSSAAAEKAPRSGAHKQSLSRRSEAKGSSNPRPKSPSALSRSIAKDLGVKQFTGSSLMDIDFNEDNLMLGTNAAKGKTGDVDALLEDDPTWEDPDCVWVSDYAIRDLSSNKVPWGRAGVDTKTDDAAQAQADAASPGHEAKGSAGQQSDGALSGGEARLPRFDEPGALRLDTEGVMFTRAHNKETPWQRLEIGKPPQMVETARNPEEMLSRHEPDYRSKLSKYWHRHPSNEDRDIPWKRLDIDVEADEPEGPEAASATGDAADMDSESEAGSGSEQTRADGAAAPAKPAPQEAKRKPGSLRWRRTPKLPAVDTKTLLPTKPPTAGIPGSMYRKPRRSGRSSA